MIYRSSGFFVGYFPFSPLQPPSSPSCTPLYSPLKLRGDKGGYFQRQF